MQNEVQFKIQIHTSPEQVWEVLTHPVAIQQYFFGAHCDSSWTVGDRADFYVLKEGNAQVMVKGEVLKAEPPKLLEYTLFPTGMEIEDIPENYLYVRFELREAGTGTELLITQGDFEKVAKGELRYQHTLDGWMTSLPKIKELAENWQEPPLEA
ncbi:MAG: SRPBCC domain-containing protein [Phaeodactylibacter sp.]|nr:SRPBCC domain-containing protein [Phaeodactylibacter sp.]